MAESNQKLVIHSRGTAILLGNIVPQVIGSIFVIARAISKIILRRSWGADDTVLMIAWVTSICLTIMDCIAVGFGAGARINEKPSWTATPSLKLAYGSFISYLIALSLTKVTICLFYLRIFADRKSRILSIAALASVILYTIPLVLVTVFQCKPVNRFWNASIPGTCIDIDPLYYVAAACNISMDIWLLAIVVPRIMPLNLPPRQKAILMIVVSLGWIVIIASTIRIVRVSQALHESDKSWSTYDTSIWSAIEVDVSLLCVSAPATKPLLLRLAPNFMKSIFGAHHNASDANHPYSPKFITAFPHRTLRGTFALRSQDPADDDDDKEKMAGREEVFESPPPPPLPLPTGKNQIMRSTSVSVVTEKKRKDQEKVDGSG